MNIYDNLFMFYFWCKQKIKLCWGYCGDDFG